MNNIFDSFKLTLFELVGYVLPGLFFQFVFFLLYSKTGLSGFGDNLPIVIVLSYPIGQILHTVSNILDYDLNSLGWQIYHKFKETDKDGHGVAEPKTLLGLMAKRLRSVIEKSTGPKEKNETDLLLRTKLNLTDLSGFDLFFVKESILAESSNIATNFEHLHYQKIFNKSMAFIFICLTFFFPLSIFWGSINLHISNSHIIHVKDYTLWLTLASAVIYKIFYERSKFFKTYRDKIMNSAVRIYLNSLPDKQPNKNV